MLWDVWDAWDAWNANPNHSKNGKRGGMALDHYGRMNETKKEGLLAYPAGPSHRQHFLRC
jgi:hypothetical protein